MTCIYCDKENDEYDSILLKNIVNRLNEDYLDNIQEDMDYGWIGFSYQYASYIDVIMFNDMVIWSSEDDEREYCEHCDEYHTISIEQFIRKRYKELVCKMLEGIAIKKESESK